MPADWVWGGPWDTVPTGVVPTGVVPTGVVPTGVVPAGLGLTGAARVGLLGGAGSGDPAYKGGLGRRGGPTCEPETETTTGDWQVVGSG